MKIPENGCSPEAIRQIQKVMEKESSYAAAYKHMYEVEQENTKQYGAQATNVK